MNEKGEPAQKGDSSLDQDDTDESLLKRMVDELTLKVEEMETELTQEK